MRNFLSSRPRLLACFGVSAVVVTATAAALGQGYDCARLRAQIASAGRGVSSRAAQYQRAADRQRSEIDRTVAYAHSIGCDRGQFLFFGSAPPPQCGQINAQVARMQANLEALQQAAAQAGGANDDVRRELMLRYNAYCSDSAQTASAAPAPRNLFDFLFGGGAVPAQPQQEPQPPLEEPKPPSENTGEARGGPKAVCVRTCDGGFFPVSYSARSDSLDALNEMCHALCPNTEVTLYTYSIYRDIQSAISIDGAPYSDLPNALKFQKNYDPACTCRPAGKTWAETLADAERLMRAGKTDIIVTPEKADELSRPKPAAQAKGKAIAKAGGLTAVDPQKALDTPIAGDDPSASEGVAGAQVPTASKDSAGIGPGSALPGSVLGVGAGETRETTGPGGTKRRVRVIAPTL